MHFAGREHGAFPARCFAYSVIVVVLVLIGLTLSGALYEWISVARDNRMFSAPGEMVNVGGHRLHATIAGEGLPVVVLEAGAGGTSLDWVQVQPQLAEISTVIAYDRAGLGWSESGPTPRTSGQAVEELRALLGSKGAKPPYVLVGHSFGGLTMKLFAAKYPEEVGGLVLVDAVHEDFYTRMPPEVSASARSQLRMLSWGRRLARIGLPRLLFPPLATRGLPVAVQPMADSLGRRSNTFKTVHDEAVSFEKSANEVRNAMPLRKDLPITVLTRGQAEQWPPDVQLETAEQVWKELQAELAELSTNTKHQVVENSGHYVHVVQPEVVLRAVRDAVAQVGRHSPNVK